MPDVSWRLDGQLAHLRCGPLSAGADLLAPSRGLAGLRWQEQPLAHWQILGVEIESIDEPTGGTSVDRYERGGDLVVTYEQTPTRPLRVQIYWRGSHSRVEGDDLPVVDLQVSTQTNLLDSRPALTAISLLPNCETLEVAGGTPRGNAALGRLFRPDGLDVSYVELVHPADFHGIKLTTLADGGQRLTTPLFGGALEKGVILRARVRGVFLPRKNDQARAAQALADFCRQPPPLTT
jgi:hypothetical protein